MEKYQKFAYFDMFLCRKIEKCNFWVKLMQKGLPGRDYEDNHEERDQTAPFCLKSARRDQNAPFRFRNARGTKMQKVQKFQGRIAIRENLGF